MTNGQVSKDGSSLTIHNATVKDHGLYQCLAETNISGEKPILTPINVIVHREYRSRLIVARDVCEIDRLIDSQMRRRSGSRTPWSTRVWEFSLR